MPETMPDDAKRAARGLLREGRGVAQAGAIGSAKEGLGPLAASGDLEAQQLLGALSLELEADYAQARSWFERAAAGGDPAAQRSLGHLYAGGLGVTVDMDRAVELFRRSAAGGDVFGMFNLASANIRANGAYASYAETLSLLRAAAEVGMVEAWARLGDLLARADEDEEALSCYVKAAEAGHVGSINAVACWYRDGTAGEVDLVQSARWFMTLLRYGNGDGVHEIFQFARRMTPDQIREAARLAGDPASGEIFLQVLER